MGWRSRSLWALVGLFALGLFASGCTGPQRLCRTTVIVVDDPPLPPEPPPTPEPAASASWTLLLYVDADCFDGAAIVAAMNQFLVPRAGRVRVLALIDQPGPDGAGPADLPTSFCALEPWTEVRLLEFVGDDPLVIESWGESDVPMNAPATLQRFVARGLEMAPAEHVALWTFGHGHTWSGVCDDYSAPGSVLRYPAMAEAIERGLADSGVAKLELLIVNSCYSACLEALLPLSRTTDWIIASEKLTGTSSIAATDALRALEAEPQMDGEQLGRLMVETYRPDDLPGCGSNRSEYGCALVRAADLPKLGKALAVFCRTAEPLLASTASGSSLTQTHAELLAARVTIGLPGPDSPPGLIACCEAASCGRDPDDVAACQETADGPIGGCCQADLLRLLQASLDVKATVLQPLLQDALAVLQDAVVCRATDASQATYGGVSIFFPCRGGDLDAYPNGFATVAPNATDPLAAWRSYVSTLVVPGCTVETQLSWKTTPALAGTGSEPAPALGFAADIEVAAGLKGPVAKLAAAWFSVRDKDSQLVLLEIPLDTSAIALTGELRHVWRGRSAVYLEGLPAPALLRLTRAYTTGHGVRLQADQTPLRWLFGEGEGATAVDVLASALLPNYGGVEILTPGTLREIRSFGRRGSVPLRLPAGVPIQTPFGSTTIVSDPPRVVWGAIPRTMQVEVGFRCVDRLGGQVSAFTWWDTRTF